MTTDDIRKYLDVLGLSQRAAARELGVDDRLMRSWCAGKYPVPRVVALAIKQLAKEKFQ
jgi:DNA-binding transcriptional regulator YdaS (Cro superfamily)